MKLHFTPYRHGVEAFAEVERFLGGSYGAFETPRNWFIDRWNFTFTVGRVMHRASVAEWESGIGLWRDESGRIAAMAHEEEQHGDVFFEFDRPERIGEPLLDEMFDFAERACVKTRWANETGFALRVPQNDRLTSAMAERRGYRKGDWDEPLSSRPLPFALGGGAARDPLPKGLALIEGHSVEPAKKALAHALAFGYADRPESIPDSVSAFEALLGAHAYRPDLDLAYRDENGDIACFAGFWFDPIAGVGILEPLGTVPAWRKKGLAERLVDEGSRRLAALGAKTLFVGSDQPFYLAVGFETVARQDLWEYRA